MIETKFKNTEIGMIPEEWSICNFGDIFTFFSNNTLSRDMLGERGDMHDIHYGDVLIKYGSTLDVEKESIPSIKEEYCYKSTNIIEDGDIIIADTAEDEVHSIWSAYNMGASKRESFCSKISWLCHEWNYIS